LIENARCLIISIVIKSFKIKNWRNTFDLHQLFKYFYFAAVLLTACSSLPNRSDVNSLAAKAALHAAQPALEKIFFAEAPILPASQSRFPLVNQLPGKNSFNPFPYQKNSISYAPDGTLLLSPGDYLIPVMTYCMKVSGSSPNGHAYALALLQGTRATIIREINMRATPRFSPNGVQILSWSLQAGLSYDEMTDQSRHIIDTVTPERKNEIKESFLQHFENGWNRISENSNGLIPSFEDTSDDLLSETGEVGTDIVEIRNFRRSLREAGNDYLTLRSLIDLKTNFQPESQKPTWSQISDRVYARFVTRGHFQELGQIQIRVLPPLQKRNPSSTIVSKITIDLSSWLADPRNLSIQPLSFSTVVGSQGVLLIPELADAPLLAAAALGAILASEMIDWDAFHDLSQLLTNATDARVRQLIQEGNTALQEAHDELEKPAREAGVIDKSAKDTTEDRNNSTRQYDKPGGIEALQKDFDKFPEETRIADDGTEYKDLPKGNRIVKRLRDKNGPRPVLEIQPQKGNGTNIRIKVRYTQ
jgi:hypothetical protein